MPLPDAAALYEPEIKCAPRHDQPAYLAMARECGYGRFWMQSIPRAIELVRRGEHFRCDLMVGPQTLVRDAVCSESLAKPYNLRVHGVEELMESSTEGLCVRRLPKIRDLAPLQIRAASKASVNYVCVEELFV